MTPALAALREITAGRVPADNALLQNCRLEGFGTRAFGREPILDLFRRFPVDLSDPTETLESPRAALVIQDGTAIFADLHDERVSRLWVLGHQALGASEPNVSIPRDLDLTQSEADVIFDPVDHPDLDPSGAATVAELTRPQCIKSLELPPFSLRVFVIRAFSTAGRSAALMHCAGALDAITRKPFTVNIALVSDASNDGQRRPLLVKDQAGLADSSHRAWSPNL